jgi:hypothetical protein
MTDPQHQPVPLKRDKDQTIKVLIDHYAADNLTVQEFEARLDSAYAATTTGQLDGLLSGLPVLTRSSDDTQEQVASVARAPATSVRERGFQIAVMSVSERKGEWAPPRHLNTVVVMGGADLDFRQARMPPGVTEVHVVALMGGVDILVPPGLAVETHGFGFMGVVEGVDQAGVDTDPDAPRLVIKGFACMGAVEVAVRLPGESARDARRRRRDLKRQKRHHKQLGKGSGE